MDSDNQKVYPPLNTQNVYPSQQQHQQAHPMAPPSYEGNPNSFQSQQPYVINQQPTTVIVQTARLGPESSTMTCPSCRAMIQSSVKYEPSTKTHIFAGVMCLLGLWCGCCLIPYCVDSCQSANHSCPNCGTYLGSHSN